MAINLSSYSAIQSNLFVKLDIPGYQVLTFSDYHKDYSFGGTTYQALGELLSVTQTTDELRASPKDITITISGVPAGNISEFLDNKVKGSSVEVYRGFFNTETGELLPISGNPAGKFYGVIGNFEISDDLQMGDDTGQRIITLNVTSIVELLNNKRSGRRTNPADFPNESSMNRVSSLAKSNFNFGAPK